MKVTIFGASGPTGLWVCLLALAAGHEVTGVSRHSQRLPVPKSARFRQVKADAQSGEGVLEAVSGTDAVLSTLGTAYSRDHISIYSDGTANIIAAMRASTPARRLVVVSSGMTPYPPPRMNPLVDHVVFPFLHNVLGKTLYQDMRAMEKLLAEVDDIDWTIMRPGRLVNNGCVSNYRLDRDYPSSASTARADLAAAMVDELVRSDHVHAAVSPTTVRTRK